MSIQGCRAGLTHLMEKCWLRSRWLLISFCLISISLPLSCAIAAPLPVADHATIPPILIQVVPMTLPNQIFRRWIHSREEDQGDIRVYRPTDYPFPPARGRDGLEFRENGEYIHYQIGPTDRSLGVSGQWSIKDSNAVAVQFPNQSISSYTLTILECDDQILKVRQSAGNAR